MEHGKRQSCNYCIDEVTLKQAIGERGIKKLHKYLCQNAGCSRKPFSDPLEKRYLTHPEGKMKYDNREEPYDLVNMQGDSNTTKQRKRSSSNKKRKTNAYLSECACIGKIIHIDTIAQTDGVPGAKNKSTGIFKKKNIYTQSKEKYDVEEIDNSRNIIHLNHSKQKKKLDVAQCRCADDEIYEHKFSENINKPKKSCIWLGKRRRRSRTVWPQKVNEDYECYDASNNIKSHNEYKLKEISKLSKKNKKVSSIRPQKGYKDSNICANGICAKSFREKRDFVCRCKEKPRECTSKTCAIYKINNIAQSKSMKHIKKIKSLITCICYNSKKMLLNKKILHKPINTDPDAYKKDIKVAIMDKIYNSYEPECHRICFKSKIENKKSPKKSEMRKREDEAIDVNVSPEHKLKGLSQKNKGKPSCGFPCNTAHISPYEIKIKKLPKNTEIRERINKLPKTAGDQTGEPIIKIEVDAIERCVLNPDEIKHKLTDLNQKNKGKNNCIYPSCNNRREQDLSKNLCEGRICQKMFKDKKTNFNCKCQRFMDIGGECTDRTCGSNIIQRKYNKCSTSCIQPTEMSEPQLEVQLDAKNMCLLNSEEIHRKIDEIKAKANEICPGGTCAVARCENRNLFKCKCVQKKTEITECSEETCVDEESPVDLLYYWMSKLTNKNKNTNNKMKRDPNEISKIKSMFTFICDRLKRTSEIWDGSEATKQTKCSLSGLEEQKKRTVIKSNYHRRSGLNVPLNNSRRARRPTKIKQPAAKAKEVKKKVKPSLSAKESKSSSTCKCAGEMAKRKKKKGKAQHKEIDNEDRMLKKERLKEQKIQNKLMAKHMKEENKEMKQLSKQDEAGETNCFADFFIGLLNVGIGIARCLLYAVFKIIVSPKGSYRYAQRCWRNPQVTYLKVHRWASYRWRIQRFRMSRSMKGSRAMNIITDEFKESRMYTAFSNKGRTKKERDLLEAQHKRRQQRIQKRTRDALTGCRDMLLVTMRKTPCLWVYHLCPDFYPRFLGLRMGFIKLCEMCLFCLAVVVWTPCILCCELFRGCVCCLTCGN